MDSLLGFLLVSVHWLTMQRERERKRERAIQMTIAAMNTE
jgi:hypothetical protein